MVTVGIERFSHGISHIFCILKWIYCWLIAITERNFNNNTNAIRQILNTNISLPMNWTKKIFLQKFTGSFTSRLIGFYSIKKKQSQRVIQISCIGFCFYKAVVICVKSRHQYIWSKCRTSNDVSMMWGMRVGDDLNEYMHTVLRASHKWLLSGRLYCYFFFRFFALFFSFTKYMYQLGQLWTENWVEKEKRKKKHTRSK